MWSMQFVISNTVIIAMRGGMTYRMMMISIPMYIWGIRLCVYLWIRKFKIAEDYRYKGMREDWEKFGMCAYYSIAYFGVFVS